MDWRNTRTKTENHFNPGSPVMNWECLLLLQRNTLCHSGAVSARDIENGPTAAEGITIGPQSKWSRFLGCATPRHHLFYIWCSSLAATCTSRLCLAPDDPILCSTSSPPFQPRLFTSLRQVCSTSDLKVPHLQNNGESRKMKAKKKKGPLNSTRRLCKGSGFQTPQ